MDASEELEHAEIWDDTELIDTWEEALQEYKYYHSLHARGERVEEVLLKAEIEDSNHPTKNSAVAQEGRMEDGEIVPTESAKPSTTATAGTDNVEQKADEPGLDGIPMPQAVLSVGHDESLKSLMMSWYYAGYYTGFYEGQQQANQSSASKK